MDTMSANFDHIGCKHWHILILIMQYLNLWKSITRHKANVAAKENPPKMYKKAKLHFLNQNEILLYVFFLLTYHDVDEVQFKP